MSKGVAAGSDLEMPTPGMDSARQIVSAVKDGRLKESSVDTCVGQDAGSSADTYKG